MTVRGRPGAKGGPYKTQMVEFKRRIRPWVEETFAAILVIRGVADERNFSDNRLYSLSA